jgi:hypothetical protein
LFVSQEDVWSRVCVEFCVDVVFVVMFASKETICASFSQLLSSIFNPRTYAGVEILLFIPALWEEVSGENARSSKYGLNSSEQN